MPSLDHHIVGRIQLAEMLVIWPRFRLGPFSIIKIGSYNRTKICAACCNFAPLLPHVMARPPTSDQEAIGMSSAQRPALNMAGQLLELTLSEPTLRSCPEPVFDLCQRQVYVWRCLLGLSFAAIAGRFNKLFLHLAANSRVRYYARSAEYFSIVFLFSANWL